MKVLIITYYWPPAGGSGVQRWLKFVKYLQDFSVTPIVYTVKEANYPKVDESLQKDVPANLETLQQSIWDPTSFLQKSTKKTNKGVSNSVNNGLLTFIRGNLFIPDPKVFWVKKSVQFLQDYLSKNTVDFIISTGPPHSMHLIARDLSKKTNIKWIADFRDPWSDLYYNSAFKQLQFSKKKNRQLELSVLQNADCVITVSENIKKDLQAYTNRVEVITNGFDEESKEQPSVAIDKQFSISYIGLLPKQSNPFVLFKALQQLCKEQDGFAKDLKLHFIGDISNEVKIALEKYELIRYANLQGYVSHKKAIAYQKSAQVLLLLIPNVEKSKGILTGKLFEYLTSKRPILAIGPEDGDLAKILDETKAGKVFNYSNLSDLKAHIIALYQAFKEENLQTEAINIEKFHRKNLTKQLVNVLKSLHS